MTIALVDDEKNVRLALKTSLKKEGFDILEFSDGQQAFDAVQNGQKPDLFILDIMMPVMDGITLLRKLREASITSPVMFLTSRDEEFDKVLGLELGADDYLCKPFSMRELVARIHVILRRVNVQKAAVQNADTQAPLIQDGELCLNPAAYSASFAGHPLTLTITEFRLLECFLKNKGIVFSREQLIEICYPEDSYLNDRAIDCHIQRLRKKINAAMQTDNAGDAKATDTTRESSPGSEAKIQTVYGAGYKWVD